MSYIIVICLETLVMSGEVREPARIPAVISIEGAVHSQNQKPRYR